VQSSPLNLDNVKISRVPLCDSGNRRPLVNIQVKESSSMVIFPQQKKRHIEKSVLSHNSFSTDLREISGLNFMESTGEIGEEQ
jgi:hypothetical protein